MKKFVSGLILGITLSATTAVYASEMIQVYLFPAKYVFNGESKELGNEFTTLNYQGRAYVPIRFIAEHMKTGITYDDESETIRVNYMDPEEVLAMENNIYEDNNFILTINADKKKYKSTEVPRIWSALTYTGDNEIEISHGQPLLRYYIKDEKGNYYEGVRFDIGIKNILRKDSNFLTHFTKDPIINYNFLVKHGEWNADVETDDLHYLDPGKYTIGVLADFNLNTESQLYRSELEIIIE